MTTATSYVCWTRLTLSLVPFSARYLATIFILRPLIAANMIGNIVGPLLYQQVANIWKWRLLTSWIAAVTLVANTLPATGLPFRVMTAMPSTVICQHGYEEAPVANVQMKYTGSNTRMTSATKYKYEIQVRCFNACASSGQLGVRFTVASTDFDFGWAWLG